MFYFRLALALGCTVRELLARIDSAELTEWLAYSRLEPFGEERGDVRSALVASTVANCNRDPKRKPFSINDFMPFRKPEPEQTPEEQMKLMQAAFAAVPKKG